jgi:hypothetical protein
MSLYTSIWKYGKFPVVNTLAHAGEKCRDIYAMLKKEGLIKCEILPRRRIYNTLLPFRFNKTLFFVVVSYVRDRNMHFHRMHAYHRGVESTHGHVGNGRGANGRAKGLSGHRDL